jgi:hypothetical protein
MYCPKCGKEVSDESTFCRSCGKPLNKTTSQVKEKDYGLEKTLSARNGEKLKLDWKNWNIGGKIVFISTCVSTVSMFMKWVDIGIVSQTGLSQMAFLFLILYVYPVLMLLKNKPIKKLWGITCSIVAVGLAIWYISSKSIDLFGETANAAASGAWLFLLSSIALIVGVVKYTPYGQDTNSQVAEQYEVEGERKGPVGATEITNLVNKQVISNESRKTPFAKTSDVPPPLTRKAVKRAENYGLKKKLSMFNAHKIKNPELYGGHSNWSYWLFGLLTIFLAWPVGLIVFLIDFKSKSAVRKCQAQNLLITAGIGFILMLGVIVEQANEGKKVDLRQTGQVTLEGVYDAMITRESGDKVGAIITIRKAGSGYFAKWDRFEVGEQPTNFASNLPVSVSGNIVSFPVGNTVFRGEVNKTGLVSEDGITFQRKTRD